jgi:hypothetical protein
MMTIGVSSAYGASINRQYAMWPVLVLLLFVLLVIVLLLN